MKIFLTIKILIKKTKIHLIKFLCVGSFCSLSFIVASNLFLYVFKNEIFSLFCGNIIGILCGYFLQMRITFRVEANHRAMFIKYLTLNLFLILYSQLFLYIANRYAIPYWFSTFGIALSVPLFSYPIQRFWIFKGTK